jgi:hypothetical protein
MADPEEGEARYQRNKSDVIRISGLEATLAERTEKLYEVSELFHDFLVKLKDHDTDTCPACPGFGDELNKLLHDDPDVRSWFEVYRTVKLTRDQQLRNQALSRMSKQEAGALGLLTEWEVFQRGITRMVEPQTGRSVKCMIQELPDAL